MESTKLIMTIRSQNHDDLNALTVLIREGWEITSIKYQGVDMTIYTMCINLIRHWECE